MLKLGYIFKSSFQQSYSLNIDIHETKDSRASTNIWKETLFDTDKMSS